MTGMAADRTLPWDWFDGRIPENVELADSAYVETSFSFVECRSQRTPAVTIGRGTSTYLGTMFDVGQQGRVTLGDFVLVHGARIICDAEITLEDYVLISWNVVLMDTYRVSLDPAARRLEVALVPQRHPRRLEGGAGPRPIRVGRGAWIGFDTCVLPGVTIGEGAIVGARSVLTTDVEPFTIVAGNPARPVRRFTAEEIASAR
jgi:acetyltransferase-like isoleucine patch superfamily enzyme